MRLSRSCRGVVSCALLLAVSACAHSAFSFHDLERQSGTIDVERPLTAEQVDADIALALFAFDRAYAGKDFIPRAAWRAMRAQLRALQGEARSSSALCDAVAEALWELPDARVTARLAHRPCGLSRAAAARKGRVGGNRAQLGPWRFSALGTTAVLAISNFFGNEDARWQGLEEAIAGMKTHATAIIDLRGNAGEDDTIGAALADALADAHVVSDVTVHERRTKEALTLLLNDAERALQEQLREERSTAGPVEYRVRAPAAAPPLALGQRAFKGLIAVLVDAECSASCERTLALLRKHPRVRVFGERTAGNASFTGAATLVLPESGIRLEIPTVFHANGRTEKAGAAPDVAVAPDSDAFELARAWLEAS